MAREVWISFGVGKHHRYIAAHAIAATLGPTKAPAWQYSMCSQEVTLHPSLQASAKGQHGRLGTFFSGCH